MKKLLVGLMLLSSWSLAAKMRVEAELTMGNRSASQTLLLDENEHAIAEFGPIELDGWVQPKGDEAIVGLIVSLLSTTGKKELSQQTIHVAWGTTATFICPSNKVEQTILKLTPYQE